MKHDLSSLPRGINHIGITVPNVEEATIFFKNALGAKVAYDGLTHHDTPRGGAKTEKQLGLTPGTTIRYQRMLQIGTGPSLEIFELETHDSRLAARLQDIGLNHLSFYVDDIESAYERLKAAGATMLSNVHGNSRYEDTPGNGSVYGKAPWGTLIELQSIPGGHYYPDKSETQVWTPPKL